MAEARELVAALPNLRSPRRSLTSVHPQDSLFGHRAAGWEACGVELSEDTSKLARERYGVHVMTGSLQDIAPEIESSSLDVVSMGDVLEHVRSPREDLEIVATLLRPGGYLVLTTPNVDGLYPRLSGAIARRIGHWPAGEPPWHLTQFCVRTLTRMLMQVGFEVTAVRHVRIPLSYSFRREPWSFKRLSFAAVFAPFAIAGPRLGRGDKVEVIARRAQARPALIR